MVANGLLSITLEANPSQLKGFRGFTLAEVLITLVIIGAIAAMTIPTLMNNTNKQEYVSRLKKAYSTLTQVTNRIIADEGNPRSDIGGWGTSTEEIFNKYKKYLGNVKVCGVGTAGCFQGTYKNLQNGSAGDLDTNRYTLIMADGSELSMTQSSNNFSADCSRTIVGSNNACQVILVDVNGAKKPNKVGHDVFTFTLKENGLYPTGCDSEYCEGTTGWGCACKVLREGAINYL